MDLSDPGASERPPRSLAARVATAVFWLTALALLLEGLALAARVAIDLGRVGDVGYPDSAMLVRLAGLLEDGRLFPPLDEPPYLVTLYGPLTYVSLAASYLVGLETGLGPTLAVRATQAALFLACVGVVGSLAWRIVGSRSVAVLAVLLAVAGAPLKYWVIQMRGDFLALLLSLCAVALALRGSGRRSFWLAAVLAGCAILAKQTFVSAFAGIFLWQLWEGDRKAALGWMGAGIATVAVGYGIAFAREPAAWSHVAALGQPITEYGEAFGMLVEATLHPKALYWPIGALVLFQTRSAVARPLTLYCALSWMVAAATIPQVGGHMNYFWEPWFASSLLSAIAVGHLVAAAPRMPAVVGLALIVLHARAMAGGVLEAQAELVNLPSHRARVEQANEELTDLRRAVGGRMLLSSDPAVAAWSEVPVVPDPFLTTALLASGSWDPAPLLEAIEEDRFDVVVGYDPDQGTIHRGLRYWNPMTDARVSHSYRVVCRLAGRAVWLGRDTSPDLEADLRRAGCLLP